MQAHQAPPFLLQQTEKSLSVQGNMLPSCDASREIQVRGKTITRSLFAYRIPYLPERLTSPHLVNSNESERLAEVLNQNTQLITNLGKHNEFAYALRFQNDLESGEIKIFLLVRSLTSRELPPKVFQHFSTDITTIFNSFEYPLESVSLEHDLRNILSPIRNPMIIGLRQHEELAAMTHGDAYVVYPFHPPQATWIAVFQTLLQQNNPCVLSIYLEPTQLYSYEQELFTRAAQLAETLSDVQYEGYITKARIVDPIARVVARLYNDYVHRLINPYLLMVHVASSDPLVARNIAQALASEITETHSFNDSAQNTSEIPSGYDIVIPQNNTELEIAKLSFEKLEFLLWGASIATEGKERLPYLVDAHTAATAFRFPIAIHGGIPGIRTRQVAPSYDVGPRVGSVQDGEIMVGQFSDRGGIAVIPIINFTRHMLVAGTTGSGKTTTCMHLLGQLWERGIPFLIIEPAKTEYRTLIDSPLGKDLQVFTLGNESTSPYRLNPLEILPEVQVETHISYLRACFEAALPTFGILPSLIEESLQRVYFDKGWDLTERGKQNSPHIMPTLGELYFEVIRATEERGYSEKTQQDIRAAAAGRIGSLLIGSKGRMLNTRQSIPLSKIMTKPTILELESLNDEEKALVIMFLLTAIREYCLSTRVNDMLQHVTLIEEAHRVMAHTPHAGNREISADTRAQAVSIFGNTLSEVRAFGEGIIIAEQIPSRLSEEALKNTNVKIVHRLPGRDDREALGGTMNLNQEQEAYLSKLLAGQAAFFAEGYEYSTYVLVPNYKSENNLPTRISEQSLEEYMNKSFWNKDRALLLPFSGCRYCKRVCRYRDRVAIKAYDVNARRDFQKALWKFEKASNKGNVDEGWKGITEVCKNAVSEMGEDNYAAFCYFSHLWGYEFTQFMVRSFWRALEEK